MQPLTPTRCLRLTFLTCCPSPGTHRPRSRLPRPRCAQRPGTLRARAAAANSCSHSPKPSLDRGFLLRFGAGEHPKNLVAARAGAPRCFEGKYTRQGRMLLVGQGSRAVQPPCKHRGQQQSETLLPNHSPTGVIGQRDGASSSPGAAVPTRGPQLHMPAASRGGLTPFCSSCSTRTGWGEGGVPG